MYITKAFNRQDIKDYAGEKNNKRLHIAMNNKFRLPLEILSSADPVKAVNDIISKHSLFTFSFVRHPYRR